MMCDVGDLILQEKKKENAKGHKYICTNCLVARFSALRDFISR